MGVGGGLRLRQPAHGREVHRRRRHLERPRRGVQLEDGLSDMPWSVIGRQTVWGHQIRWAALGNISVNPTDPEDVVIVWADRGTAEPERDGRLHQRDPRRRHPTTTRAARARARTPTSAWWSRPTVARPGPIGSSSTTAAAHSSGSRGQTTGRRVRSRSRGTRTTAAAPADTFQHVLWVDGGATEVLGAAENLDVSVTHWAGQYTTAWPAICGPAGYTDGGDRRREGKDCNVFHGDYTGLAVGPGRRDPRRVDRPEPARHVAAGRLLHRRRARRLRAGRDVRAAIPRRSIANGVSGIGGLQGGPRSSSRGCPEAAVSALPLRP